MLWPDQLHQPCATLIPSLHLLNPLDPQVSRNCVIYLRTDSSLPVPPHTNGPPPGGLPNSHCTQRFYTSSPSHIMPSQHICFPRCLLLTNSKNLSPGGRGGSAPHICEHPSSPLEPPTDGGFVFSSSQMTSTRRT